MFVRELFISCFQEKAHRQSLVILWHLNHSPISSVFAPAYFGGLPGNCKKRQITLPSLEEFIWVLKEMKISQG